MLRYGANTGNGQNVASCHMSFPERVYFEYNYAPHPLYS